MGKTTMSLRRFVMIMGALSAFASSLRGLQAVGEVSVGFNPRYIVFDPFDGRAYVNIFGPSGEGVVRVNGTSLLAEGSLKDDGVFPRGFAMDSATNTLFIADFSSSRVVPLDLTTGTFRSPLATPGCHPLSLAYSSAGAGTLYVSGSQSTGNQPGCLLALDPGSGAIAGTLATPSFGQVAFDGGLGVLFLADSVRPVLMAVSGGPGAMAVAAEIAIGAQPSGVAVNPATHRVYVGSSGGRVWVVDATSDSVVTSIPVGNFPLGIAVRPSVNRVYVTVLNESRVVAIDGATNIVVDSAPAGASPWGVAVDDLRGLIFAANDQTGSVSVYQDVTAPPTSVVSGDATVCAGGSAFIQAALTGTPPWNLTWSDGIVQTGLATSPATRAISPASTTIYTVTAVSDAAGPGTASGSATITVNPLPIATAAGSATIDAGASTPLSGSGGSSCAWSPALGLSNASSCTPAASPASTTTYTLAVTDSNGCVSTNAPTVTVTITNATATTLAASSNPNPFGRTLTLTASVASPSGSPTGVVTFREGAVTLGVSALDGSGRAGLKILTLTAGSHVIDAAYSGDSQFAASFSTPLNQTVTKGCSACPAQSPGTLFATSTTSLMPPESPDPPANSAVEVVDLAGVNAPRVIPLPNAHATSIAVSADQTRAYVVDNTLSPGTIAGILVVDLTAGAIMSKIPLASPRDCVLSPDGGTLFVTASNKVAAIDTTTHTVREIVDTGESNLGIAVSPDGGTLATPATAGGGGNVLFFLNTSPLSLRTTIPLDECNNPFYPAYDIAFVDSGRLLVWNVNCWGLYAIDVASGAQLDGSIVLGNPVGSFVNFANRLSYSHATGWAFTPVESQKLAIFDPAGSASAFVGPFSGVPFVAAVDADGRSVFIADWNRPTTGGAQTLDRYDLDDGTLSLGTYTFTAGTAYAATDLKILPSIPSAPTPSGSNVSVTIGATSMIFSAVTNPGTTLVRPIDPAALNLTVPAGFAIDHGSLGFEITTTATYTGPIQVCFDASPLSDSDYQASQILHGVAAVWVTETTTPTPPKRLCATVSSLSPFAIARRTDMTAPSIQCAAPDALWHGADVRITCTASDAGSGLANSDDASFILTTSVAAGTETPSAQTDIRRVCDRAGNCATAGPIGNIKVDRKPPSITISAPAGSASFVVGQTVSANYACVDGGSGIASCTGSVSNGARIDTGSAGSKTFAVSAADAAGNTSSRSVAYTVTQGSTAASLTSSAPTAEYRQTVTFMATVTALGSVLPTGAVTFKEGETVLGSGNLSGGVASFSTGALAVGTHSIVALYGGDTNFTASASTAIVQTITRAATATSVVSSVNPSRHNSPVIFTATVTSPAGTPTGTVSVTVNGTLLDTDPITNGSASVTAPRLDKGVYRIVVSYLGDALFAPSTSAVLTQTVQ